eukprot:TRINITY_DN31908_c0_g1_i1.p1 TRINITY_DN31908_c0_g1~~TRINITY_DN31908_c0_g1_i1.p1  ORF type:complete len:325 (-),score=-3.35 TRINITY_DN31908_c0_g1_i1:384-1358(-)
MEFTNFYNIKTEQSVNPFMHLAARAGIPGLVTTNVPANAHQAKDEKLERQQDHTTNTVHIVQVPAIHHQQTHHVQPANDTAFPGAAPIRHNTSAQHRHPQQAHIIQPTQYTIKQQGATEQIQIKTTPYTPGQQKEKIPKERLYKCGDCEKAFMREEHLKRHTLVHTGHPMHSCEVPGCNKTYTRKDLLTNHLKYIHLGVQPDRPFLCIDCGKDFVRRDHLQRHRKNVHGTGPMAGIGSTTASQTSTQNATTAQQSTPNPDRPKRRFLCVICGKDFNRKDHLQRHQKNVHHQGQNTTSTVAVAVEVASSSTTNVSLAPHPTAMSS